MRLNKITIENFRGIEQLEIELERDITVLIGENNTGKTSALKALRFCLEITKSGRTHKFSEADFYRDKTCPDLEAYRSISITLSFCESEEHPWSEHIKQRLNEAITSNLHRIIRLRITAEYDVDAGEVTQNWHFLNATGNKLPRRERMIKELRQLRPFFLQTALRAVKDQFQDRSTYWSSFLENKDIDDGTRQELEGELYQVNQKVIDAHPSFKDVIAEVGSISKLVNVGKIAPVTIDPAPTDVYKTLKYGADVNLLTASNVKIPIREHGEGTQSLYVLLLFSAYLKKRLQLDIDKNAEPIIAIEEPEAHLHSSAVRAVWQLLCDLPGQKIVATHSGDILSEVPTSKIRRLMRDGNVTRCKAIPPDYVGRQ